MELIFRVCGLGVSEDGDTSFSNIAYISISLTGNRDCDKAGRWGLPPATLPRAGGSLCISAHFFSSLIYLIYLSIHPPIHPSIYLPICLSTYLSMYPSTHPSIYLPICHLSQSSDCMCTLSCPTLCSPLDCGLPDSSVKGISQATILEWVAISSFRGSSQLRYRTQVSCIAG